MTKDAKWVEDEIVRVGKKPPYVYVMAALSKFKRYNTIKLQGFGIRIGKTAAIANELIRLIGCTLDSQVAIETQIPEGKSYGTIVTLSKKKLSGGNPA
jgi:DNA-binding protein